MVKASTNEREWRKAMKLWRKAKRTPSHAEVVNHFAIKTLFNAIRLTPKARLGQWPLNKSADPEKDRTRATLKSGRKGKSKWKYKDRFYYALAAKEGARKGQGIRKAARKLYRTRRSASGAMKAGFFRPINDFGKLTRKQPFAGGSASRSYGRKAKPRNMKAMSMNMVEGSGEVAFAPMQAAKSRTIQTETQWALRHLQKANDKFRTPSRG